MVSQQVNAEPALPGAPPKQVHRAIQHLDKVAPGWKDSGHCAVDVLIDLHKSDEQIVRLAMAVLDRDEQWRASHPNGVRALDNIDIADVGRPDEQWRVYCSIEPVVALRLSPGLTNIGAVIAGLPADSYEVVVDHLVLHLVDLRNGQEATATAGDWLIQNDSDTLTAISNTDFSTRFGALS